MWNQLKFLQILYAESPGESDFCENFFVERINDNSLIKGFK